MTDFHAGMRDGFGGAEKKITGLKDDVDVVDIKPRNMEERGGVTCRQRQFMQQVDALMHQ